MSGIVSQSESNRYYKRLVNISLTIQGAYEEIKRLQSEKVTLDLGANLDEESSGTLSKAEAIALFLGPLQDFESWYENVSVAPDGDEGSETRRGKIDPFLAADGLI